MATIFLLDWRNANMTDKARRYAEITVQRWAERQGGAAFVSVESNFILTDYRYDHKEVELLRHILNCDNVPYRAIANVDLDKLGEESWARAIIGKNNKTHNN